MLRVAVDERREDRQHARLHHQEGHEREEAEHRQLRPDAVEHHRVLLEVLLDVVLGVLEADGHEHQAHHDAEGHQLVENVGVAVAVAAVLAAVLAAVRAAVLAQQAAVAMAVLVGHSSVAVLVGRLPAHVGRAKVVEDLPHARHRVRARLVHDLDAVPVRGRPFGQAEQVVEKRRQERQERHENEPLQKPLRLGREHVGLIIVLRSKARHRFVPVRPDERGKSCAAVHMKARSSPTLRPEVVELVGDVAGEISDALRDVSEHPRRASRRTWLRLGTPRFIATRPQPRTLAAEKGRPLVLVGRASTVLRWFATPPGFAAPIEPLDRGRRALCL